MSSLTIVMPVYNERATLRTALDRLLAVEMPVPTEILVVDDGSTDGCTDLIADLVEASTGVNLWREWAKIEIAQGEEGPYEVPARRADYGGLILSLSKQERPDTSAYNDPELVWRLDGQPPHHVGFIVRAGTPERVEALLDEYEPRISRDFMAHMPAPSMPTS